MPSPRTALAVLAASLLNTPAAAQAWTSRPVLSTDVALTAARAAMQACRDRGFAVAVAVLDPRSQPLVLLAAEDASALAVQLSERKAHTALVFGAPSAETAARALATPGMAAGLSAVDGKLAFTGGGLPLKRDGRLVGAIGVSGGPNGQEDEGCALAGASALAR